MRGSVRVAYRAEVTARYPYGAPVDLGGWVSYSPGRAVGWIRKRAEQVAQQLGAPYDRGVRAWLDDAVECQWAVDALAAGTPVSLTAVDAEGCAYVLVARPCKVTRMTGLRTQTGQGAAAWHAV